MELSTPAYIASVAYLILVLVIIFTPASKVMHVQGSENEQPSTFASKLVSIVLLLIPVALSIYSINCFAVGGCVVWSWINAVSVLLWVLLLVLVLVLSSRKQ
jgi:hypothetical protein